MNQSYPRATWRLITTPPASGAWNMAVDEALLLGMDQPAALPVLRLYAWDPPCLSLGYAQPITDLDQEAIAANGWQMVRRPTGGRAILHTDELTYSVITPVQEIRLAGTVIESYQRLAGALLAALQSLGLPAEALPMADESAKNARNPAAVCFEVPSHYEITVQGKKLLGSAQARKKEGVLQHGSLPLTGDISRIIEALVVADRPASRARVRQRAATAGDFVQPAPSWDQAAQAMQAAFANQFNITWQASVLSPQELALTDRLVREKYAHPSWTERV